MLGFVGIGVGHKRQFVLGFWLGVWGLLYMGEVCVRFWMGLMNNGQSIHGRGYRDGVAIHGFLRGSCCIFLFQTTYNSNQFIAQILFIN